MNGLTVTLSQWQFALTTVYHFFFVPLTIGLVVLVAIMETLYVRSGKELYLRMTKFWGKLFLINFSMGVVTGIVLEFQFGMNWSEYSRFVGDIFGAPLAIEALLAFFLESTFLGIWIFSWDKLSKRLHLASIWLVAFGSIVSAFFILVANSFMQAPTGFVEENGRLVMSDFFALLTNPNVWYQFPHTVTGGFVTGAFFIIGISAYHLIRKNNVEFFQTSFKLAAIFGFVSLILVIGIGHVQGQHLVRIQPMKMAAAEAIWESEDPAALSVIAIIDEAGKKNDFAIKIPYLVSFLSYNTFTGEVKGINELQAQFVEDYGPGDYVPPVTLAFWSFRLMLGAGFLMLFMALYVVWMMIKKVPLGSIKLLKFFPYAIILPYVSNTFGWLLTETGRQPWVVYGKLKTVDAVSPNLTSGMILTTLIGFVLVYGILMAADVYLLAKYAKAGPTDDLRIESDSDSDDLE